MQTIRGKVQEGQKRGKALGFPTANIPLSQEIPEGIYVSTVSIDGFSYQALTFIGAAKTFDETTYQSETYILDFDQDLYGKEIAVELHKKIRDNQKFTSVDELVNQMKNDTIVAKEFFKTKNENSK